MRSFVQLRPVNVSPTGRISLNRQFVDAGCSFLYLSVLRELFRMLTLITSIFGQHLSLWNNLFGWCTRSVFVYILPCTVRPHEKTVCSHIRTYQALCLTSISFVFIPIRNIVLFFASTLSKTFSTTYSRLSIIMFVPKGTKPSRF